MEEAIDPAPENRLFQCTELYDLGLHLHSTHGSQLHGSLKLTIKRAEMNSESERSGP